MSGSRAQLAADLAAKLLELQPDESWTIHPDPRSFDLEPGKRGTLQIVRNRVKPAPVAPQALNAETLHVWVITHQLEQPAAEDNLDELLDDVLAAFLLLGSAGDPDAERMQHPAGHHAYRIAVTYTTEKE